LPEHTVDCSRPERELFIVSTPIVSCGVLTGNAMGVPEHLVAIGGFLCVAGIFLTLAIIAGGLWFVYWLVRCNQRKSEPEARRFPEVIDAKANRLQKQNTDRTAESFASLFDSDNTDVRGGSRQPER
jgi:hypothetical protein